MSDEGWDLSMARKIEELRARSKFSRIIGEERVVLRLPSGKQFYLRQIVDIDDPALREAHKLLEQNLLPDEVDPFEIFRSSLLDESSACHIVEDEQGTIYSLSQVQYLEFRSRDGDPRGDSALFVAYIVTREDARGWGFAGELYQAFYEWARDRAHSSGHNFWGVVGETVDGVERFLNSMGRKRIYFQETGGDVREVPYILPPLDWDKETGSPLLNPTTEHFMVWRADGRQRFSASELLDVIRALYGQTYPPGRSFFRNDEAYAAACSVVQEHLGQIEDAMVDAKEGEIFLMSIQERAERVKALAAAGLRLIENL